MKTVIKTDRNNAACLIFT